MLDKLRAASNHILLKIVMAVIVISFILTGVGNYLIGGGGDYAAKINGDKISRAQLEYAFNIERDKQRQALGENFSQLASNEHYMLQLRQQVLSQLIDRLLLQKFVDKLNIKVSDEQIKLALLSQPMFQTDGLFDNAKFKRLLADAGYNADSYANMLRGQLADQQFVEGVTNSEFVLPEEGKRLIQLLEQQRKIRTAKIDLAPLIAQQSATDNEIALHYQQNKHDFMTKEQFRVSYVTFAASDLQPSISKEEVTRWYEQKKADYTQPERVRYRVIQTKTEGDAQAILSELASYKDFASLAKAKSIDPVTASRGGDLGWLEKSMLPNEIAQANLTQKGAVSGIIKGASGFFIVELDDQQPAYAKPLSQVYQQIETKLAQEKALDAWYQQQQKVRDAAGNNNESLTDVEKTTGIKVQTTEWFTQETLPQALNYTQVQQSLFDGSLLNGNGSAGVNSEIITTDDNRAFLLRVEGHKAPYLEPLEVVKTRVEQQVKRKKAERQAEVLAEKILKGLSANKNEALRAAKLNFTESRLVTRYQQGAEVKKAFALPMPHAAMPSYGSVQDAQGDILLIALDDVVPGEVVPEKFTEVSKELLQNNIQFDVVALTRYLRETAKISYGDAAKL